VRAIAGYACAPDAALTCPIYAFLADDDPIATSDKVLPRAERTTSDFAVRVFGGGHFYLNDHLTELVEDIQTRISQRCAPISPIEPGAQQPRRAPEAAEENGPAEGRLEAVGARSKENYFTRR
jgi:hypothetical protein